MYGIARSQSPPPLEDRKAGFHPQSVFLKLVQKAGQTFDVSGAGNREVPRSLVIISEFSEKDAFLRSRLGGKEAPARILDEGGQSPPGYQGDDNAGKTGLQ
jgi:hypothetical protein